MDFARAELFDASALVKLFCDEPRAEVVREYFNQRPTVYTTGFCFYEALNILKAKWKSKGKFTQEQYLHAAHELTVWYAGIKDVLPEIELADRESVLRVRDVAARTGLDYSDALQLVSLKQGTFSRLCGESQTVLTTADRDLAYAARNEGFRVWFVMEEDPPQ